MAELNPKTDATKKVIHLMVTPLCNRNCRYCCNKQYDIMIFLMLPMRN